MVARYVFNILHYRNEYAGEDQPECATDPDHRQRARRRINDKHNAEER
jgi:hypothetical protein